MRYANRRVKVSLFFVIGPQRLRAAGFRGADSSAAGGAVTMSPHAVGRNLPGETDIMHYRIIDTAWGQFGLVASERGVVRTLLPDRSKSMRRRVAAEAPTAKEDRDLLPRLARAIESYFADERGSAGSVRSTFDAELDLSNITPFRRQVYLACARIPAGTLATYSDLAGLAGSPAAVRAVGSAMANNPLPLLVPCHRIVRSDGTIGGFSSTRGVSQKKALLRHEGVPFPLPHPSAIEAARAAVA